MQLKVWAVFALQKYGIPPSHMHTDTWESIMKPGEHEYYTYDWEQKNNPGSKIVVVLKCKVLSSTQWLWNSL